MSDRKMAEIREAYELWIAGCTTNGIPDQPKPQWDIEFAAFHQGYRFGLMSDDSFDRVTERMRRERPLATCHCGRVVAAMAEPGVYANPNMVDDFCGECITVRCDAYPGACSPTRQSLGLDEP